MKILPISEYIYPNYTFWNWGKGNNQTFRGLLDTGSELTLIPGDPKKHCGPPVGAYGGQVINGVLTDVRLTVGPVGPRTHPVVISPVPECIIGIDILRNWPFQP